MNYNRETNVENVVSKSSAIIWHLPSASATLKYPADLKQGRRRRLRPQKRLSEQKKTAGQEGRQEHEGSVCALGLPQDCPHLRKSAQLCSHRFFPRSCQMGSEATNVPQFVSSAQDLCHTELCPWDRRYFTHLKILKQSDK